MQDIGWIIKAVNKKNNRGWNVLTACVYLKSSVLGDILKLLEGIIGCYQVSELINNLNNEEKKSYEDDQIAGNNLMHLAASLNDAEAISILIDYGGSLNTLNNIGLSPPALSISSTSDKSVPLSLRVLLERGANISNEGDRGRNCLSRAIEVEGCEFLLSILRGGGVGFNEMFTCRGKLNEVEFEGIGAVSLAAANGDIDKVEIIFDYVIENDSENDLMDLLLHSSKFKGFNPTHGGAFQVGGGSVLKWVFEVAVRKVVERLREGEGERVMIETMIEQGEVAKVERMENREEEEEEVRTNVTWKG